VAWKYLVPGKDGREKQTQGICEPKKSTRPDGLGAGSCAAVWWDCKDRNRHWVVPWTLGIPGIRS
jgi:hypothetical protein